MYQVVSKIKELRGLVWEFSVVSQAFGIEINDIRVVLRGAYNFAKM